MRKSFNKMRIPANATRDPRFLARAVLGLLLLANLIAAYAVFRPLGGSAQDLDSRLASLSIQLSQNQAAAQRMRALVSKIEGARTSGNQFLTSYFTDRRSLSSTILQELNGAAKQSGIIYKEHSFTFDPVEGSDNLSMVTISGNYEGKYSDLLAFVNRLDRSGRFLILDTLTAAPVQGSQSLNVNIRFNTFVREDRAAAL